MTNPENTPDTANTKRRILTPEERQERYIREISKIKKVMFDRERSKNDTLLQPTTGPGGVERIRGYSVPARVSDMNDGEQLITGIACSEQNLLVETHDTFSEETVFIDYNLNTNEVRGMRQTETKEGEPVREVIDEDDNQLLGVILFRSYDLCNPQMTTSYEEEFCKSKEKSMYRFQLAELQDMQEPLF